MDAHEPRFSSPSNDGRRRFPIAWSRSPRKEFTSIWPKASGKREQYRAIPSGVDTEAIRRRAPDRETARERLGYLPEERIVLGVGRLVPVKGFDIAVRALPGLLARIPDARLVLVGDGPERPHLEGLAVALRVRHRLTITGTVDDVPALLAAADILVVPSRNEGMGRVLVEAMALGVPVVAAKVGGVASVIEPGRSGELALIANKRHRV